MDIKINKDFALLYGILLGDRCLSLVKSKKKFVVITGSLKDDLPFFKEIICPILRRLRGKETSIKKREKYGSIEFNFIDTKLFDFINNMGFPIGKKGPNIIIPEIFYKKNLIKYITQGFFATDGSLVLTKNPNKFYPRLEAHTIHKHLTKQFYKYLTNIGMSGGFYKCEKVPYLRWKTYQNQYRFQFNGKKNLLLFNCKIGFINQKHKNKFSKFIEYSIDYDKSIMGIPANKVIPISNIKNNKFVEKMALGRIELPISSL